MKPRPDDNMKLPAAKAFHATVEGEVQGVGFRWSALRVAAGLGLVGWVRNTGSGAVEVWAEGGEGALLEFLEWLHQGPSAAWVRDVRVAWQPPEGLHRSFEIAH